jgi:hypothetical protein
LDPQVLALVFTVAGAVLVAVALWRATAAAVRLRLGVRRRAWPRVAVVGVALGGGARGLLEAAGQVVR